MPKPAKPARRAAKPTTQAKPPKAPTPADLGALREAIDHIDQAIIQALNRRAELVVQVGQFKRAHGIPVYAPHREAEVLSRVLGHSRGPLQPRTIEAVYREVMSGSFALERPISIGFLGPRGSFSHVAAVKHFGSSVDFQDLREIAGVFTEVERGHVEYGLVPIENSIHGGVTESLDAFIAQGARDDDARVRVYAEVQLEIHHALMANCAPDQVHTIYSKPEVFSQCRNWLATQYPKAELVPVASSSRAVQIVAQQSIGRTPGEPGPSAAAIGNALAGELYGVHVLFPRIEDNPNNITRFCVIARQSALRSGDDKTSVMFTTANKPGALVSVLQDFHAAGVNLTHIDKRPSGRTNWSYTFFIDAQGHAQDPLLAKAIESARRHCKELHVLGSYPRSKRILA